MAPIEHERSIGDYGYKYPRWISFKARGAGKPRCRASSRDPRRRKRRREIREIMVRIMRKSDIVADERVARIRVKDDGGASISRDIARALAIRDFDRYRSRVARQLYELSMRAFSRIRPSISTPNAERSARRKERRLDVIAEVR